jgi:hypothetical protein
MDITRDTPVDFTEDATASTIARFLLEPDPLVEALCVCAHPPAWLISVDPMLDELAA